MVIIIHTLLDPVIFLTCFLLVNMSWFVNRRFLGKTPQHIDNSPHNSLAARLHFKLELQFKDDSDENQNKGGVLSKSVLQRLESWLHGWLQQVIDKKSIQFFMITIHNMSMSECQNYLHSFPINQSLQILSNAIEIQGLQWAGLVRNMIQLFQYSFYCIVF